MKNKKILIFSFLTLCFLLFIAFLKNQPEYISRADFKALEKTKLLEKVVIGDDFLTLYTKEGKYLIAKESINLKELSDRVKIEPSNDNWLIFALVFFLALIFALFYLSRSRSKELKVKQLQGAINKAQNNINELKPVTSKLGFKDVAGAAHLKKELSEIVDFLKEPKKYRDFGVKMPKGVLMIGPPGVGKTLIAKAVAGEAGVPFFYQSGATFVEIYVGVGAKRVRELFKKAKSMAPSIIFIDEIDAVGKERGAHANTERDSTLNQLLTQMDGFEDNSGVIVIAATNKIELLDEALLRAGRFDRRIFISLPDFKDREEILNIYMKDKKSKVDISKVAKACVGFSAAALQTLVNEAAINALRNNSKEIKDSDFDEVMYKVLHGKVRLMSLDENEKQIQAIYQAAKALCAYYFAIDFERFTLTEDRLNEYENNIKSKSQLISLLKLHLCGMVATSENFNESFTNAGNDLLKAKKLVSYMQDFEMLEIGELSDIKNSLKDFIHAMMPAIKRLSKLLLESEKLDSKDVEKIMKD